MAPLAVRGLKAALNSTGRFKFKVSSPLNALASALDNTYTRLPIQRSTFSSLEEVSPVFHRARVIPKLPSGVVGLAIAQRLSQQFPTKTTYLVERHARAGEEIRYAYVLDITKVLAHNMVLVLETLK